MSQQEVIYRKFLLRFFFLINKQVSFFILLNIIEYTFLPFLKSIITKDMTNIRVKPSQSACFILYTPTHAFLLWLMMLNRITAIIYMRTQKKQSLVSSNEKKALCLIYLLFIIDTNESQLNEIPRQCLYTYRMMLFVFFHMLL